jgi:hypothetical protein
MKNASQLLAQFEALTGSLSEGQNRYEQFNGNPACVQRWPHGGTR